jgi:hypothetical protein
MMYLPEPRKFGNLQLFFFWRISLGQNPRFLLVFYKNLMSMTSPAAGASVKTKLLPGLGTTA